MTISWSLLQFFFTKLHLSQQTNLLDNEIIRCWSYLTFWSTKSLEIWQKLLKKMKNWYILKFSSILVANCAFFFFSRKLRLLLNKYLTTNLFLVERLYFSKPPSFSKSTQKLQKIFKNLNFLVILGLNLMNFSKTNCFYLFKKTPGQQIVSLLNVWEILSHQVIRKKHKNWIKFSKIWVFFTFLSILVWIWCIFPAQIAFTSLKKLPDNELFPCWTSVGF